MKNNHYKVHKPEAIDLILKYNLNFIEGNIVKYILRSPFKGDRVGDLKKALYYAKKLPKQLLSEGKRTDFDIDELDQYLDSDVLCAVEVDAVASLIQGNFRKYKENYIAKLIEIAIEKRERNENSEALKSKNKIKRFSVHGKFFDTFKEMQDFQKNWCDLPLDINEFKRQMNLLIKCFEDITQKAYSRFSNKDAYIALRSYTDWAVEDKEDIHQKIECRIHPLSTLFAIIEMNPIDFLETIACTECEKEENELSFYLKLIDMIEGDEDFLSLLEKIGYGDKEFWKHRYDIFWKEAKKRYLCKDES